MFSTASFWWPSSRQRRARAFPIQCSPVTVKAASSLMRRPPAAWRSRISRAQRLCGTPATACISAASRARGRAVRSPPARSPTIRVTAFTCRAPERSRSRLRTRCCAISGTASRRLAAACSARAATTRSSRVRTETSRARSARPAGRIDRVRPLTRFTIERLYPREVPMPRVLALVAAVVAFVPALTPSAADAAQRTFVATSGVDLAACSLTAPCRSFAAALAQTDAGGEIIVLDSGGYGRVTIDKAVSLIAPPGVYAGISAFATDNEGVRVAAGATDKVVLSGLTINGRGANTGISIVSGGEVNIERCTIANIDFTGVRIGGAPRVYVRGTIIRNNGGYGFWASSGTPEIHVVD